MNSAAGSATREIVTARQTSFAQQRLWFLDQLQPGVPDYLLPLVLRIRGPLDRPALLGSATALVARHEVLRTRYLAVDGEPLQHVDPEADPVFAHVDLSTVPDADRKRATQDLLATELITPFDLAAGPPVRFTLVKLAAQEHLLVLVVHHIAFDGWSWRVLTRELSAGYRERIGGPPAELPPLPTQYGEYADWQRGVVTGARLRRQLDYWRDRLAGAPTVELPTDRPRPAVWRGAGDHVRFELSAELVAEVDKLARAAGATRYMVLFGVFCALLSRYTGHTDLTVGTPVAGRGRANLDGLIGLFVNTLAVRTDVSGAPTVRELLRRTRDSVLGALSHADAPLERVVAECAPERDLSRHPLFQVCFSLITSVPEPITLAGLDVELTPTPLPGTPYDLFLDLNIGRDGRIVALLQYSTALFDHDTVTALGAGYRSLLEAVLASPDATVPELTARIPALPGRERRRLLARGNDTGRAGPELTVTDLFDRQALFTPDALAVACAGERVTYARLSARVNQLANHLRELGIQPGQRVGVGLERSVDLLVAFLAVLRAGGAYVPVDPEYPPARVIDVLTDAGVRVVLGRAGRVPDVGCPVVDPARDAAAIAAHPTHFPDRAARPADLAYVIYTSGSTGRPKGVLVSHRALTNFLVSMLDRPGLPAGTPVVALTTISFDPSALELYLPLLVGSPVLLADTEQARDPQRMAALIDTCGPAVVQATPVTWRMLLDSGWTPGPGLTILSGGEKLPTELSTRLAATGAPVWDLYGPTEATVWVSTARLPVTGNTDDGPLDWAPTANSVVYLLDSRLHPVPDGGTGEVYLGGTCLAEGYHARPALTADRFVPDPHATVPGARLYRTGDLARRRPDGSVEILGRADHQVKIRGHRMEPGEIEAALLAHEQVRAVVVHPTPGPGGDPRLTAYLVPATETPPTPAALREFLLRTLPDYMIPDSFVALTALPLTANGKIDRGALPKPEIGADAPADRVAPRDATERVLADVWQDVLGVTGFGVHDNFFALGGHSLLATRVAMRLRARLGVDVPVRALFDHGTVAALSAALPSYPRSPASGALPALTARRRR